MKGHNKNAENLARTRAHMSFCERLPACKDAENQLVPTCELRAKETIGPWKSVCILTDYIAIEGGFSKHPFQGQCVTMDDVRYVHVKKNAPWFVAAVGGPNAKRGGLPAVRILDLLGAKLFGKSYTEVGDEDQDCSRGEDGELDDGELDDAGAEHDPMNELEECAPEAETPKKTAVAAKKKQAKRPSPLVREIIMPKRPPCVAEGGNHKVHVFVRPNSRALYLRIDAIDWLVSYAADEHYYQGVRCCEDAPSEDKPDFDLDYDYEDKAYICKINVGVNEGKVHRMGARHLTKELFEKIADTLDCLGYWSKATPTLKRRACREFITRWRKAALEGSLQAFQDEWCCILPHSAKRRKTVGAAQEGQTAVAASQPDTTDGASQQDGQTAVAASQQEIACVAASHDDDSQATTAAPDSLPMEDWDHNAS